MGPVNASFTNGNTIADSGNITALSTVETDLCIVTDPAKLKNTQISAYLSATLGSHSAVQFRVYVRHEDGGTWYPRVKQNASDNTLDDFPAVVDSPILALYEFPMPACTALKITAQGVGAGTDGVARAKLMARNN